MAGQDDIVGELKIILRTQKRTCLKRPSLIKVSRENADGLQQASTRGDQPPSGFERVGNVRTIVVQELTLFYCVGLIQYCEGVIPSL